MNKRHPFRVDGHSPGRTTVPRFYFDVSEGPRFMPDENGCELNSPDTAEYEATQTAIQLGREWLAHCREVCLQAMDERHQTVLAISIAMKVERLKHLPRTA